MQNEFALRPFHLDSVIAFKTIKDVIGKQVAGLAVQMKQHVAIITRTAGNRQFGCKGLPDPQGRTLPRQKTQTLSARGLQMQQEHVGGERIYCFNLGGYLLKRDVLYASCDLGFKHNVTDGRIAAQQNAALILFRLGNDKIMMTCFLDLPRYHSCFAQATVAAVASIIERNTGSHGRL